MGDASSLWWISLPPYFMWWIYKFEVGKKIEYQRWGRFASAWFLTWVKFLHLMGPSWVSFISTFIPIDFEGALESAIILFLNTLLFFVAEGFRCMGSFFMDPLIKFWWLGLWISLIFPPFGTSEWKFDALLLMDFLPLFENDVLTAANLFCFIVLGNYSIWPKRELLWWEFVYELILVLSRF